jgi:glycosyltransferase
MMRVSVITATYNSASTLHDTLNSVSGQTYPNVEHIIVDGQSADDTMKIVHSHKHIGKVISEKDKGIYDAMNKGISMATGEIIGILNSDDFYSSCSVLSKVADTFKRTGCDAVYGDLVYVDKDNIDHVFRYWKSGRYSEGAFKWGWMPPHPTFFVRKSLYEKHGVFNLDMKTAADYELMLRMIHKGKARLEYIPEILVKMRTGGASNKSVSSRIKANADDNKAWAINGVKPFWFTLYLKPIRKIIQYIFKSI